jgi:hypothetical protein
VFITPEDAVQHYVEYFGNEVVGQSKPFIRELVEQWKAFKKTHTMLSRKFLVDIRSRARFIKRIWGELKPDEPRKIHIDQSWKGLKTSTLQLLRVHPFELTSLHVLLTEINLNIPTANNTKQ